MSFLSFTSTKLGSEVSCPRTIPRKNPEDPVQLEPRSLGSRVKHCTTEPRETLIIRIAVKHFVSFKLLVCQRSIFSENSYILSRKECYTQMLLEKIPFFPCYFFLIYTLVDCLTGYILDTYYTCKCIPVGIVRGFFLCINFGNNLLWGRLLLKTWLEKGNTLVFMLFQRHVPFVLLLFNYQ